MENKEKNIVRPPRRGPMRGGPGGMSAPWEKPKNLKVALLRLYKELKKFKILMALSLVLAIFSAVLTILAPDKLSELTDEISGGLIPNTKNLEYIINASTEGLSEEKLSGIIPEILQIDLSQEKITSILMDPEILVEDKAKFSESLTKISVLTNQNEIVKEISGLPDDILKILLPESTYENIVVSTEDKIKLLNLSLNMNEESIDVSNIELPESIIKILFTNIELDGKTITPIEQYEFLKEISNISKDATTEQIYKIIDNMPESIQEVVKPNINLSVKSNRAQIYSYI